MTHYKFYLCDDSRRDNTTPKLNTQMGAVFTVWLRNNSELLDIEGFSKSTERFFVIGVSEENERIFINDELCYNLRKYPDLIAKVS